MVALLYIIIMRGGIAVFRGSRPAFLECAHFPQFSDQFPLLEAQETVLLGEGMEDRCHVAQGVLELASADLEFLRLVDDDGGRTEVHDN
jgi:hypothetical protein